MKNSEEKYYTTAVYSRENAYICDLIGNEEHIIKQLKNIWRLKIGFEKPMLYKIIKNENAISINTIENGLLLIAVIQ